MFALHVSFQHRVDDNDILNEDLDSLWLEKYFDWSKPWCEREWTSWAIMRWRVTVRWKQIENPDLLSSWNCDIHHLTLIESESEIGNQYLLDLQSVFACDFESLISESVHVLDLAAHLSIDELFESLLRSNAIVKGVINDLCIISTIKRSRRSIFKLYIEWVEVIMIHDDWFWTRTCSMLLMNEWWWKKMRGNVWEIRWKWWCKNYKRHLRSRRFSIGKECLLRITHEKWRVSLYGRLNVLQISSSSRRLSFRIDTIRRSLTFDVAMTSSDEFYFL